MTLLVHARPAPSAPRFDLRTQEIAWSSLVVFSLIFMITDEEFPHYRRRKREDAIGQAVPISESLSSAALVNPSQKQKVSSSFCLPE